MRYFEKDRPVHIISRALIDVFRRKADCYRFIFQFFTINIGRKGANIRPVDAAKAGEALLHGENIPDKFVVKEHPPLVDLLDFSLVINHNHFYFLPRVENIIPIFIQRLNNGFAKFINTSHNRKDAVFGSRYKSVRIENDIQSYTVSRYISIINPLDVYQPRWREEGLRDDEEAFDFLKNYEFSSFPDRIGQRNSKILAASDILQRYSWGVSPKGAADYTNFAKGFLKERLSSPELFIE